MQIAGKAYYELTALMLGPPAVPYVVPILLLYPANPAKSNGAAFVDFLNQTPMAFRAADPGGAEYYPPVAMGRVLMGDDFFGRFGYAYAAVQWDRDEIPFINFHEGTAYFIPTDAAQYSITFDDGDLLKHPPSALPGTLNASKRLVFGYSASSNILHTFVDHPVLKSAFPGCFDGVLLDGPPKLTSPYPQLQGLPAGLDGGGGLKTIAVLTETKLQLLDGKDLRGESAE